MAKLKIEKPSTLAPEQAYSKLKSFIENDEGLRKLDGKYTCEFVDAQLLCRAKGQQFQAEISVKPQAAGSQVVVEVEIPFALALFKGKIQEMLEHKLEKTLT